MRLSKQVLLFAVCAGAIHAQTITRVEQNDPAVTYRGTWDTNTSAANSGALAALSLEQAALASITFNGTGITWIGVKDPGAGSPGSIWMEHHHGGLLHQRPHALPAAICSAQKIGSWTTYSSDRSAGAIRSTRQGFVGLVDAFDIENGTAVTGGTSAAAGRILPGFSAISAGDGWVVSDSLMYSTKAGYASWCRVQRHEYCMDSGSWSIFGIANVSIDGVVKATVDLYAPDGEESRRLALVACRRRAHADN